MKIWKQGIIGILAVIVLIFAVIACDDGKNNLCTCNPKEHYLPCTCGGTDCTCAVIPRGYADTGKQVPIYQKSNDPAVEAAFADATLITNIATRYGYVPSISGKVKEIWIVKQTTDQTRYFDYEIINNKIIVKFQYDSPYIEDAFVWLGVNVVPTL